MVGIGCSVLLDIDVEQSMADGGNRSRGHYYCRPHEQEESRVLKITVTMTALLAFGLVVEVFMMSVRCTGRLSLLNRITSKMRGCLPLYSWKYFYSAYRLKKGHSLNVETFIAWLKKNSDAVKERGGRVKASLALGAGIQREFRTNKETHPHTRRSPTPRCCFRYIWKTLT